MPETVWDQARGTPSALAGVGPGALAGLGRGALADVEPGALARLGGAKLRYSINCSDAQNTSHR